MKNNKSKIADDFIENIKSEKREREIFKKIRNNNKTRKKLPNNYITPPHVDIADVIAEVVGEDKW